MVDRLDANMDGRIARLQPHGLDVHHGRAGNSLRRHAGNPCSCCTPDRSNPHCVALGRCSDADRLERHRGTRHWTAVDELGIVCVDLELPLPCDELLEEQFQGSQLLHVVLDSSKVPHLSLPCLTLLKRTSYPLISTKVRFPTGFL